MTISDDPDGNFTGLTKIIHKKLYYTKLGQMFWLKTRAKLNFLVKFRAYCQTGCHNCNISFERSILVFIVQKRFSPQISPPEPLEVFVKPFLDILKAKTKFQNSKKLAFL
jgi:hypothetical protein